MNPQERFYHRIYTGNFLQKVLRWFFHDPVFSPSGNHRFAEEWNNMIVAYEKFTKDRKNETDLT